MEILLLDFLSSTDDSVLVMVLFFVKVSTALIGFSSKLGTTPKTEMESVGFTEILLFSFFAVCLLLLAGLLFLSGNTVVVAAAFGLTEILLLSSVVVCLLLGSSASSTEDTEAG